MQAWGGIEMQLHSFLPSALDGSKWWTSRPGRFTHGEEPRFRLSRRLDVWALQPVWTIWRREKSIAPAGMRTPDRPARSMVAITLRSPICRWEMYMCEVDCFKLQLIFKSLAFSMHVGDEKCKRNFGQTA
jgi:hypothetical protein